MSQALSQVISELMDYFCCEEVVDIIETVVHGNQNRMSYWDDVFASKNLISLSAVLQLITDCQDPCWMDLPADHRGHGGFHQ